MNGARFGHPAHIVAAQVDQHQVFGAFLGVVQQFFFQPAILFGRLSAVAGTRNGAQGDLPLLNPDQYFR